MKDSVTMRVIVKMLARILLEVQAIRKEVAQLKSKMKG
jgi:hypothetical protein